MIVIRRTTTEKRMVRCCTLTELQWMIAATVEVALRRSELRQARTIQETWQASEHRQKNSRKADLIAVLAAIDRQNTARNAGEQQQGESEVRQIRTIQETWQASELQQARMIFKKRCKPRNTGRIKCGKPGNNGRVKVNNGSGKI